MWFSLGLVCSQPVEIDVRGALVLRVPPHRGSFGLEALEIEIGVKQIGALQRCSPGGAEAKTLVPEIGATISHPRGEPLARSHATQHDLRSIDALPESRPSLKPRSTSRLALSTIGDVRSGQSSATLSFRSAAMVSSRVVGPVAGCCCAREGTATATSTNVMSALRNMRGSPAERAVRIPSQNTPLTGRQ